MLYRIKKLREKAGMTQKELALRAMISPPYLHDLENNHRGAKPDTLARIAIVLGVQVTELSEPVETPSPHVSFDGGKIEEKGA